MRVDAPLLLPNRLVYLADDYGKVYEFPAQWGALQAPRLEHLDVWMLALPEDCHPFAALRTLRAFLPEEHMPNVSFSEVFPHLTSLVLNGVTAAALPALTPLPPALEVAILSTNNALWDPIDYASFFRGVRMPCAIRELYVDCVSGLVDALKLFVRIYNGGGHWNVEIGEQYFLFRMLRATRSIGPSMSTATTRCASSKSGMVQR